MLYAVDIHPCLKRQVRRFQSDGVRDVHASVRAVKGKGTPEYWVAVVKPGKVMFEIEGIPRQLAEEAMKLAGDKLAIKTRFIERREAGEA